jgi:hypothetical protein
MRNLWLLPDREQSGAICVFENDEITFLHETVNLAELPPALVLGIPEELLIENQESDFLFGQFFRLKNLDIFCCSGRAGKDISGRTVVVTNMQMLRKGEIPRVPPEFNSKASNDYVFFMKAITDIFLDTQCESSKNILHMLTVVNNNIRLNSFSSERLSRAISKPDWMPSKKNTKISLNPFFSFLKLIWSFFVGK